MNPQPDFDLLCDLRGLLYDWKSAELENSASAFIRYAKEVSNKIDLCKNNGFGEVLVGIDFYDVWSNHSHKQLLAFIDELQSAWDWYSKLPCHYDLAETNRQALQLFDGCKFEFFETNSLRSAIIPTQYTNIDLWKARTDDGLVTIDVTRDNGAVELLTLIPTQYQDVSEEAIQILLNLFPAPQQTNKVQQ